MIVSFVFPEDSEGTAHHIQNLPCVFAVVLINSLEQDCVYTGLTSRVTILLTEYSALVE